MKPITRISLLAAALAAALPFAGAIETTAPSAPAPAAAGHTARPHAHARTRAVRREAAIRRHLARRLKLTTAQRSQLHSIRANAHRSAEAIRQNTSLSKDEKRAQVRSLRTASRQQMDALLTPAQKTRLTHLRARLNERLGGM